MDFRAEYEKWCTDPYFDEATKAELKAIAGDDKEIEDRFYRTLEFGTAGLRGVIGAGTNRMNIYTVRQATQGLANYILSQGEDAVKRGVAIAHDSRNMHDEFTDATALSSGGDKFVGLENYRYMFTDETFLQAVGNSFRLMLVVPVFVPAVFSLYFDLFDGLIQTYVFVFLTALFMKESIGGEE